MLRVLQSGEFTRVGGEQTLKVDVRVVAATNRDLQAAVAAGQFREDLYFRLNVVPLRAPPLRERAEDIPLLSAVVRRARLPRERHEGQGRSPTEALAMLAAYPWPGNVRELRNVIERLVILSEESIGVGDLPEEIVAEVGAPPARGGRRPRPSCRASSCRPRRARCRCASSATTWSGEYIRTKLDENGWNISRTATLLGIERTNLHKKMRALGLSRDDRQDDGPRGRCNAVGGQPDRKPGRSARHRCGAPTQARMSRTRQAVLVTGASVIPIRWMSIISGSKTGPQSRGQERGRPQAPASASSSCCQAARPTARSKTGCTSSSRARPW